jgi:hypothetical protein
LTRSAGWSARQLQRGRPASDNDKIGRKLAERTLHEFLDAGVEELGKLLHLGGFSEGKRILYVDT